MRHLLHRRQLLAAPALMPLAARAQGFPDRPIRIVSPYSPGGGTDTSARLLAPYLTEFLGQPIVVENRPGAGGSLGAAAVAEAPADGHTLLVDALGHVVNPHLLKNLRFDYATAFAPISLLVVQPQFLTVPASLPVNTLAEFITWAKPRQGQLSYGSSGNGTGAHLAAVLFLREAGLELAHVPYRGGSAVIPDLIAGTVSFACVAAATGTQLMREGRLKALAVTYKERVPSLPDVPTTAECGMPAVNVDEWNAMFGVAGTPPAVLARLHAATAHALAQPVVRQRVAQLGGIVVGSTPEETARFIAERRETMGRVVREAGITVE